MNLTAILFIIGVIIALALIFYFFNYIYVLGSGVEWGCDENFVHIEGARKCWNDRYLDGLTGTFDQKRRYECIDKGDQYRVAYGHVITLGKKVSKI